MLTSRITASVAIFIIGTIALPSSSAASDSPVIDLGYARYQGISNNTLGTTTYWSLQYAAPPTGTLRWQPPIAIENSTVFVNNSSRIVNATTPGYQCVQSGPVWIDALAAFGQEISAAAPSSEDCLRLDVIVPSAAGSANLPVIVQIHGGGYTVGSSRAIDGHQLVSFSNGSIVYVQIQYRLGFYGFLGSQAVRSNGVANAGLLDQRSALDWVQRNIAKFGGDPKRVTIWGGSAGGGSVTAQMQLYGGVSDPPFRAAIAEYPWWQPFHDDDILEAQFDDLLQAANCTDLACLRNLSAADLDAANQQTYVLGYQSGRYGYGDFYAGPSVDGNTIKDLPSTAFATGRYSKVPLLTDREGYEGALFTNLTLTVESEVQPDLSTVWQTNSTAFFIRLFQLYPLSDFGESYFATNPNFFNTLSTQVTSTLNNSVYWQTQSIFGDVTIACPTYYIASSLADAGQPVYKLVFYAGTEIHASTAPFFTLANSETANATLAAQMKSYFLGFAVNLDPNAHVGNESTGASRPNWPTYLSGGESQGYQVMWVNTTNVGARPDPDANSRCDFFSGQQYIVRH